MIIKISKQTAYWQRVAQRAINLEELVAWVKDEQTKEKISLFREKLRRAYPERRYLICHQGENTLWMLRLGGSGRYGR